MRTIVGCSSSFVGSMSELRKTVRKFHVRGRKYHRGSFVRVRGSDEDPVFFAQIVRILKDTDGIKVRLRWCWTRKQLEDTGDERISLIEEVLNRPLMPAEVVLDVDRRTA